MASGILGTQSSLSANTLTTIYTVPATTVSYVNFNVVNTNATPVTVRIALSATGTPTAAEYIEYNAEIAVTVFWKELVLHYKQQKILSHFPIQQM